MLLTRKRLLDAVVNARAKATQVTISPDNLNEVSLQKYQAAQGELSQALGRLLMVTENYPDLKANQNFLELQAQLEGTENPHFYRTDKIYRHGTGLQRHDTSFSCEHYSRNRRI